MNRLASRMAVAAALATGCMLNLAQAQPAPGVELKYIEANCVFVAKSALPMPAKEALARFAMRMPPSALGGRDISLTVPVRINLFFDVFVADSMVARTPVTIPIDLVLKPGDLGTLDIGWNGSALRITRNGTQTITRMVPLVGDEVYVSMAIDSPMITFTSGNLRQFVVPLASTTIFHEGGTPETITAPRDAASGQATGD